MMPVTPSNNLKKATSFKNKLWWRSTLQPFSRQRSKKILYMKKSS